MSAKNKTLHLTWLAFFLSFFVWFSFAPFAITIQSDLGLTSEQIKTLAVCNLSLTIPARIVIGMILDRWGARITFTGILMFAVIPCFLTGFSTTFLQLVISNLIMGIMGAGFVAGVRILADWFPPKEIGMVQGIYGGWGNFGAAAAQLLLPSLGAATALLAEGSVNWRLSICLLGILCAVYGLVYWCNIQNTPNGQTFCRPKQTGGLQVTSRRSFWAMTAMDLGLWLSLGLLCLRLYLGSSQILTLGEVMLIGLGILGLYLLQLFKSWKINRELLTSSRSLINSSFPYRKVYPATERYEFRQVALLSFTYLTNFGSQIAVISVLPIFFAQTFEFPLVQAGLFAASFPFLNLLSRPSGGIISDRLHSRKWVMTGLTAGIGVGYLLMAWIDATWSLAAAAAATLFCAFFVQAGAGATFSLVPLIKKEITGQIAGNVGAYGNVGGVIFLTIYSFSSSQALFQVMGVTALICASLCAFFLKEPLNSFAGTLETENLETDKLAEIAKSRELV